MKKNTNPFDILDKIPTTGPIRIGKGFFDSSRKKHTKIVIEIPSNTEEKDWTKSVTRIDLE